MDREPTEPFSPSDPQVHVPGAGMPPGRMPSPSMPQRSEPAGSAPAPSSVPAASNVSPGGSRSGPFGETPTAPPADFPAAGGVGGPGRRRRRAGRVAIAVVVAASLSVGGYGLGLVHSASHVSTQPTATSSASQVRTAAYPVGSVVGVVEAAQPAVVNIVSTVAVQTPFGMTLGHTEGTGFVVDSAGLILTNDHVIAGARRVVVTLNDGRSFTAQVLKTDPTQDLAVLKVAATGLPTLSLADSSAVVPGEEVVAIGYALGLEGGPSVTSGIISAVGRTIQAQDPSAPGGVQTYQNVFQTSAAINPGNSGGPLLDMNGNVVGITSAGASSAQNIGFAIPIGRAKSLIAAAEAAIGVARAA